MFGNTVRVRVRVRVRVTARISNSILSWVTGLKQDSGL